MPIFAYACLDPIIESPPGVETWGEPPDRLYLDYLDAQGPTAARPHLQQLLQVCQQTPPDRLLVRQLADLGDSAETVLACLEHLEAQGVVVLALQPPYCSQPQASRGSDRATWVHLTTAIQAQLRQRRLQAGHAQNRVQGRPPPGKAPYGYRRGRYRYALDRTAAPVVRAFFEHFLLFGSIRGSVRYLETTLGKRISASTGQRWLTHPVYRGDLVYKAGQILRDTHTPLISRQEAAQVDRLLRRNRRLPPKTASAQRSLAGLVQCQECQSRLRVSQVTRPHQSQTYLYLRPCQCPRPRPCRALPYQQVLDQTIAAICQTLPAAVAQLAGPPVGTIKANLQAEIDLLTDRLAQLPQLQTQGILDQTTATLRAYTLRSDRAALEQQCSQLPPENLLTVAQTLSLPRFWQDLSEAERRVYLREFIDQVLICRRADAWQVQIRFIFATAVPNPGDHPG